MALLIKKMADKGIWRGVYSSIPMIKPCIYYSGLYSGLLLQIVSQVHLSILKQSIHFFKKKNNDHIVCTVSVLTLSIFSWSSITHDLFSYIGFYCCSWNKIWTCLTKVLSWQYLCWIKNKYIQKVSPTRDIVPSWEVKHHVQDTDFLKKKKKWRNISIPRDSMQSGIISSK